MTAQSLPGKIERKITAVVLVLAALATIAVTILFSMGKVGTTSMLIILAGGLNVLIIIFFTYNRRRR